MQIAKATGGELRQPEPRSAAQVENCSIEFGRENPLIHGAGETVLDDDLCVP